MCAPKLCVYDRLRLTSMKLLPVIAILVFTSSVIAQSGRHATPPALPTPSPEQKPVEAPLRTPSTEQTPQVTAEKNQDYRCTDDVTLARILESASRNYKRFLPNDFDT